MEYHSDSGCMRKAVEYLYNLLSNSPETRSNISQQVWGTKKSMCRTTAHAKQMITWGQEVGRYGRSLGQVWQPLWSQVVRSCTASGLSVYLTS